MDPKEAIITAATVIEAVVAGPMNGDVAGLAGLRQQQLEENAAIETSRIIRPVPGEQRPH